MVQMETTAKINRLRAVNMGDSYDVVGFLGKYRITRKGGFEELPSDLWCDGTSYYLFLPAIDNKDFLRRSFEEILPYAPAQFVEDIKNVNVVRRFLPMILIDDLFVSLNQDDDGIMGKFLEAGALPVRKLRLTFDKCESLAEEYVESDKDEYINIGLSFADLKYEAMVHARSFDIGESAQVYLVPFFTLTFESQCEKYTFYGLADKEVSYLWHDAIPEDPKLTGKSLCMKQGWISFATALAGFGIALYYAVPAIKWIWGWEWISTLSNDLKLLITTIPVGIVYLLMFAILRLALTVTSFITYPIDIAIAKHMQRSYVNKSMSAKLNVASRLGLSADGIKVDKSEYIFPFGEFKRRCNLISRRILWWYNQKTYIA